MNTSTVWGPGGLPQGSLLLLLGGGLIGRHPRGYPFDGIVGEDPELGLDRRLQTLTPVHRLLIVEGDPAPGVHGGLSPGLTEADGGRLTPDASAGRVGEPMGPPVIV
jgi:hypothetical protein